jgi:hypothetical protein
LIDFVNALPRPTPDLSFSFSAPDLTKTRRFFFGFARGDLNFGDRRELFKLAMNFSTNVDIYIIPGTQNPLHKHAEKDFSRWMPPSDSIAGRGAGSKDNA